ncbi:hypothetical protein KAH55_10175 [bacterium]|nr:hypothetical protein [bacterium]
MRKSRIFLYLSLLMLFPTIFSWAAPQGSVLPEKLQGLGISAQWFLAYQYGESKGIDYNAFMLKRGYINFTKSINEHLSARITPDVSVDEEGDGRGDIEMRLKYCYVRFSAADCGVFTQPFFEFGVVHRPWLDFEQHINHYRVEGTMFLERAGMLNSADYGLTFISLLGGKMDKTYQKNVTRYYPGRYGSFALGVYNGGGYHAIEANTNKTLETRLTLRPFPDGLPGLQMTYTGAVGKGNTEMAPDWQMNTGFLSFETRQFVLTGQYFQSLGNSKGSFVTPENVARNVDGYSVFGEWRFAHRRFSLFARYDYQDCTKKLLNWELERYIAGIAMHFQKGGKIIFNYDRTNEPAPNAPSDQYLEFAIEMKY